MITTRIASQCSSLSRNALIALGCALSLALIPVSALKAADTAAPQAASLPVTAKFEKSASAEKGPPFVLTLTNTSKASLTVSAKILLSVVAHSETKARKVPAHVIAPGESWTIADLAAQDKVTVTAEGFAPLELTVK
jgi:hypothetical protein